MDTFNSQIPAQVPHVDNTPDRGPAVGSDQQGSGLMIGLLQFPAQLLKRDHCSAEINDVLAGNRHNDVLVLDHVAGHHLGKLHIDAGLERER